MSASGGVGISKNVEIVAIEDRRSMPGEILEVGVVDEELGLPLRRSVA